MAAFLLLFGLLSSHSILETARDALFLSKLPAGRLPWVYMGVAAVSLAITQAQLRFGRGLSRRTAVAVFTLVSSAITFAFFLAIDRLGSPGLFALYIWSGVLTTLVLVHFWTLLGTTFSIAQAKRVYGFIGTGSVAGAIAGSALASALGTIVSARHLLAVSAAGFLASSMIPRLFRDVGGPSEQSAEKDGLVESAIYVAQNPYARRLGAFVIVSTAALTVADFTFKSIVAAEVPKASLASFFGTTYLALNALSLVAQVGLVAVILRRFHLGVALAVLPIFLAAGSIGVVAFSGIAAALAVKGADGVLKHSLHRTASELLFVPIPDRSRARVKAFVDVIGQRGGQTAASLIVLALASFGAPVAVAGVLLAGLSIVWILGAFDLRRSYVELVRRNVEGEHRASDFPELDVASLETLYATLDSADDVRVVAALDVLEREGRSRVVPALILHHPSERVVTRALALLTKDGRRSAVPTIDRLLDHASAAVRASVIAARSVLEPDDDLLRARLLVEDSPEVRAAITVNLIASGAIVGTDADGALRAIAREGSEASRIALATAMRQRRATGFDGVLLELARSVEPDVRIAAIRALGEIRSPASISGLIDCLEDDASRRAVREELLRFGDAAFDALVAALADGAVPARVRAEVPRVIASFARDDRAPILLARLPEEEDGLVRYRIIRALEAMVSRDPTLALDRGILARAIDDHVSRAYRYLDRRLVLSAGAERDVSRKTPGHEILIRSLQDKERNAESRLFRLLALAHPNASFGDIASAIRSRDEKRRASAIELIENVLEPPLRGAVVGLVDGISDRDRLAAAGPYHRPVELDYEALLALMLASSSESVRAMTAYHIGELRLAKLLPDLETLAVSGRGGPDVDLAVSRLSEVSLAR